MAFLFLGHLALYPFGKRCVVVASRLQFTAGCFRHLNLAQNQVRRGLELYVHLFGFWVPTPLKEGVFDFPALQLFHQL